MILYLIGSGPIQGFAVTLAVGILTSMFTAILGSRALVNLTLGRRKDLKTLWI
jgi:preprotein translocase subunit SecD